MTELDATQFKDWAAILSAILSPFIGAIVAVWTYRSQTKEKLVAKIVWGHTPDRDGQPDECPFLYVQSKSDSPIEVVEISYLSGTFFRRRKRGTALYYEDPFFDISFPYTIESGKSLRFKLNESSPEAITETASRWQQILQRYRSMVWLEVKTLANVTVRIPAWDATPWKDRASWLQR